MSLLKSLRSAYVLPVALLLVASTAEAGPPLLCHPFVTGEAALLPWDNRPGWNTPDPAYDVQRLTADTVRLLTPQTPVLVRMENLRRAAIYASQDAEVAQDLLSQLLARTRSRDGQESRDPHAWFDAGYLVETYRQASVVFKTDMLGGTDRARWALRAEPTVDGYAHVVKAIGLAGGSPDMDFAASLIKTGSASAEHHRRAVAGARAGSLLARNLAR